MRTLHILRSKPDTQVRELMRAVAPDESTEIALYEEAVDYHQLVDELFCHERVISWW